MDKKLKTKWVKALLSGRYKQTTGALQRGGRNCCLGVLCRVDPRVKRHEFFKKTFVYKGVEQEGDLSYQYLSDIKLTRGQMFKLIDMNDDKKKTFSEIAAWIKKNL